MTYIEIIAENKRRLKANRAVYNPLTGEGCESCQRVLVELPDAPIAKMYLPEGMLATPLVKALVKAGTIKRLLILLKEEPTEAAKEEVWRQFIKLRIAFDFEYWAYEFAVIKKKNSSEDIPFYLNRGQRKLLKRLYKAWLEGKPIRIILLKARQWGGSTLVQLFMIWIQLVRRRQWHSVICAHVENTAKVIRGMYSKLLKSYPTWLLDEDTIKPLNLVPFENSQKTRQVKERACRITIGSAEKPDGVRGDDTAMAHLSEVGLWAATAGKKPEDLVQSIVSGIGNMPDSMIVYESTAKGVGNFFHREWLRAKKGESGFDPVFVAWFDIELYQSSIDNYKKFIDSMSEKEHRMFSDGATLEGINWYREQRKAYSDEWRFISEMPSNDVEAFQSTGRRFYPIGDVDRLRKGCMKPLFVGEVYGKSVNGKESLQGLAFREEAEGNMLVWAKPGAERYTQRYVTVVDIGGRSEAADNSCITVIDRMWMAQGGVPEVVAEWCGHIDHDLLAWKAAQIAKFYHNSLLVIESNTLETEETEGDHFEYILDEIADAYPNLFSRTPADKIREGVPARWGFHTNRSSKQMVCDHHKKALREDLYIENSIAACDEHDTLEVKENGSLGAVEGCRDDRHITRAIGVWVCYQYLPAPQLIETTKSTGYSRKIVGEATI